MKKLVIVFAAVFMSVAVEMAHADTQVSVNGVTVTVASRVESPAVVLDTRTTAAAGYLANFASVDSRIFVSSTSAPSRVNSDKIPGFYILLR